MHHPACLHRLVGLLLTTVITTSMAHAQDTDNGASKPASAPNIADGSATRAWLKTQETGSVASKHKQTLSGPVMSRVHERYVNSFSTNASSDKGAATAGTTSSGSGSSKP